MYVLHLLTGLRIGQKLLALLKREGAVLDKRGSLILITMKAIAIL